MRPATRIAPPYRCQFASANLVDHIVGRRVAVADDPRWAESGARSPEEYAFWARAGCGMACLQMLLEEAGRPAPPLVQLAEACEAHGGYRRRATPADGVDGLFYAGFVRYVEVKLGLTARVAAPLPLEELVATAAGDEVVLASVHHAIRWPDREAPGRGGHLVLVFDADDRTLRFNNPSGHRPEAQRGVTMTHEAFAPFYAGRGIAVRRVESNGSGAQLP